MRRLKLTQIDWIPAASRASPQKHVICAVQSIKEVNNRRHYSMVIAQGPHTQTSLQYYILTICNFTTTGALNF